MQRTGATPRRPPLPVWLRYRLLGSRVPAEFLPWVEQDLSKRGWWLRTRLLIPVAILGVLLADDLRPPRSFWEILITPAAMAAGYFLFTRLPSLRRADERERRRLLAYQRGGPAETFLGRPFERQDVYWLAAAVAIAVTIVIVAIVFLD